MKYDNQKLEKMKKLSQLLHIDEEELRALLGYPTRLKTANTFNKVRVIYEESSLGSELEAAALRKLRRIAKKLLNIYHYDVQYKPLEDRHYDLGVKLFQEINLIVIGKMGRNAKTAEEIKAVRIKNMYFGFDSLGCFRDTDRQDATEALKAANGLDDVVLIYNQSKIGWTGMELCLKWMAEFVKEQLATADFDKAVILYGKSPTGSQAKRMSLVKLLELI